MYSITYFITRNPIIEVVYALTNLSDLSEIPLGSKENFFLKIVIYKLVFNIKILNIILTNLNLYLNQNMENLKYEFAIIF